MKHLKIYESADDIKITLQTCVFSLEVNGVQYSAFYDLYNNKVGMGQNHSKKSGTNFLPYEEQDMLTKICNDHIDQFLIPLKKYNL